jgi:hypothetical protein
MHKTLLVFGNLENIIPDIANIIAVRTAAFLFLLSEMIITHIHTANAAPINISGVDNFNIDILPRRRIKDKVKVITVFTKRKLQRFSLLMLIILKASITNI